MTEDTGPPEHYNNHASVAKYQNREYRFEGENTQSTSVYHLKCKIYVSCYFTSRFDVPIGLALFSDSLQVCDHATLLVFEVREGNQSNLEQYLSEWQYNVVFDPKDYSLLDQRG